MFRRVLTREMQWRFQIFGISSRKKGYTRLTFFLNGQFLLKTTGSLLIIILLQIANTPLLELTTGSLLLFSDLSQVL